MGGTDDPNNLLELTVAEHAEAHRMLFEKYGRWEDEIAWKALAGIIGHEEAVKAVLCAPKSSEHIVKLSVAAKGNKNANGLKTEAHKLAIGKGNKGKRKGVKPWNAGLNKSDPRVMKYILTRMEKCHVA